MADFHDRETVFEPEPTGKQKPQPTAPGVKTSPTPALAPGRIIGGRYVIEVATSLNNLAALYYFKDDYPRAEPLYQRALTIQEKALGANHPDLAASLNNLARLYQTKGDAAQALIYQSRGNEVREREVLRNLVSGSERQKALYLKKSASATDAFRRAVRNQLSLDRAPGGTKRKQAEQKKQNVKELGRNLEALVDSQGKYLVETYEFSYLTSGRDLLRLQTGIKNKQSPLVIANPDYSDGNGPKLLGAQFQPLTRLPGTTAEAEFLKTAFPTSAVYFDAEATEAVLTAAKRPEFLHIGTPGYFFPDVKPEPTSDTESNRLITHDERPVDVEKLQQENPLLRSYLFFAGANHSNDTPENDGILTALEASNLNLWGTKLVVLSACDTGLGDVRNGDGVYGLRRALVLAGSESQMVSLWPVSDEGTRDLMIRYYQLLKHGVGRSQALRQIRLEFLKNPKRRHPYFWASFILSGEWATLSGSRE